MTTGYDVSPPGHDVFVSYRRQEPDQSWVQDVLVPALDAQDFAVCVDYRSFELGAAIIESMANCVLDSRYTVAVMSPRFFASGFTELERIMAQHLGLEEGSRRLIGLMLEECAVPLELSPFLWLDVTTRPGPDSPELERLHGTIRSGADDSRRRGSSDEPC